MKKYIRYYIAPTFYITKDESSSKRGVMFYWIGHEIKEDNINDVYERRITKELFDSLFKHVKGTKSK